VTGIDWHDSRSESVGISAASLISTVTGTGWA